MPAEVKRRVKIRHAIDLGLARGVETRRNLSSHLSVGPSHCEQACVRAGRSSYEAHYDIYLQWRTLALLSTPISVPELQNQLLLLLDDLQASSLTAQDARKIVAAVVDVLPWGSGPATLPRIQRELRGFGKVTPQKSRPPFPLEMAAAVAMLLTSWGYLMAARMVITIFFAYLRPGTLRTLLRRHVLQPARKKGALKHWALVIAAQEDAGVTQIISKTGTIDETIVMDQPDWIGDLMDAIASGLSPGDRVFPLDPVELSALFRSACRTLGLPPISCLYMLRHGGASHDLLMKLRTFEEVRSRGQWRTDTSVRRYAKSASVQRFLLQCPPNAVTYGNLALPMLRDFLLAKVSPIAWAEGPATLPRTRKR